MKLSIVASLFFASTAQAFIPSTPLYNIVRTNDVSLEMAKVTAAMVKELRERTGSGMMDCKKALTETDGDIEQAVENMRISGAAKAAKKSGKVAAEGIITVKSSGNTAVLLEVNCQTDFVAKDTSFVAFCDTVAEAALADKMSTEDLQAKFEDDRIALVTKIGENISIRRAEYMDGSPLLNTYLHGSKIGVVVSGDGDESVLKNICMHVAASRPDYLTPEDVPEDVVEKEQAVQMEIAMNEGKPEAIAEKMVTGRMKKFKGEVSLTGQAFVMEPKKTVGEILKSSSSEVTSFKCIEVGEGIDKGEQISFAEEVAAAQQS